MKHEYKNYIDYVKILDIHPPEVEKSAVVGQKYENGSKQKLPCIWYLWNLLLTRIYFSNQLSHNRLSKRTQHF